MKQITTIFSLLLLLNSSVFAALKASDIDPANMQVDLGAIILMVASILMVLFKGKTIMRLVR